MGRARDLLTAGLAHAPFAPSVGLVAGLARAYGRVACRVGGLPLTARARRVPAEREALLGEALAPAERRAIAEEYFLLQCLHNAHFARRLAGGATLGARLELEGRERLEAALAPGRGVVLVTAHFGMPGLLRPALAAAGVPFVAASRRGRYETVRLDGDLWERTGALHRLRDELSKGRACVLMADGGVGSRVTVPFFRERLPVGLGGFALARLARCPVLPTFVVGRERFRAFRVEIGAPLPAASASGQEPFGEIAHAFARRLEPYVRRHPGQLYFRDEVE
jgi:KDO2-lipid IV(A) lauroyltransferase